MIGSALKEVGKLRLDIFKKIIFIGYSISSMLLAYFCYVDGLLPAQLAAPYVNATVFFFGLALITETKKNVMIFLSVSMTISLLPIYNLNLPLFLIVWTDFLAIAYLTAKDASIFPDDWRKQRVG